jgi:hypothetical protein
LPEADVEAEAEAEDIKALQVVTEQLITAEMAEMVGFMVVVVVVVDMASRRLV